MKKILCISMVLMFPLLSLETSANPFSNSRPWEKEQVDTGKQGASKDTEGQQDQDQQAQKRQPQE